MMKLSKDISILTVPLTIQKIHSIENILSKAQDIMLQVGCSLMQVVKFQAHQEVPAVVELAPAAARLLDVGFHDEGRPNERGQGPRVVVGVFAQA